MTEIPLFSLKSSINPETAIRCAIEFDEEQQSVAYRHYLTRSRLFWNLLLRNAQEEIDHYVYSDGDLEENQTRYLRYMNLLYETLLYGDLEKNQALLALDEQSIAHIKKFRELPYTTLRNRYSDILHVVRNAKLRMLDGSSNLGIPRIKSWEARQSIRFEPGDYFVEGDTIRILGEPELKIKNKIIRRMDFSTPKSVTLNWTKHAVKLKNLVELPKGKPFYYITVDQSSRTRID